MNRETARLTGVNASSAWRKLERAERAIWDFQYWKIPRRPTLRILVVVDGRVGVDADYFFGIGKMVEILRKNAPHADPGFSYAHFDVQIASRDELPIGTANYTEFRFDQMVDGSPFINQFDQIWCFGFHPGNTGDASDTPIEDHATQVSDSELRTLTTWMNERKGGVLAMGDHHFLGATLAWKIPRVRSMRRWTNADGVPPIDYPITSGAGPTRYRHDTNQPQNALQADPASSAVIPISAEEDGIPQPIDVRYFGGLLKRPHPILCGGPLGVIDVLPDHPHEGWVYDDAEVPVGRTYDFGAGVSGPDFPAAVDGGSQPLPQVVAWANPLPEPPYDHQKQPTPVTRFPVIGAYDGHRANVGRVVVDSTWHHWFNMNLDGLQDAADGGTTEEVENWQKIKTYFRNVAVWLSPPAKQRSMLTYAAFWSLGSPLAVEGYDGGMPAWELGETARDILGQFVGNCMLVDWIAPFLPELYLERFRIPPPEPCLTCPPLELLENAALGGLIKAMLPERERVVAERLSGKSARIDVQRLAFALDAGSTAGLKELQQYWAKSLEHSQRVVAQLADVPFACRSAKQWKESIAADLAVQDAGPDKRRDVL